MSPESAKRFPELRTALLPAGTAISGLNVWPVPVGYPFVKALPSSIVTVPPERLPGLPIVSVPASSEAPPEYVCAASSVSVPEPRLVSVPVLLTLPAPPSE